MRVTRDQILAFRAAALHLDKTLPLKKLVDSLRPCGLQDTPPGNAALGVAARVRNLTIDAWTSAFEEEKSVVALWAMRGSPFVIATDDLPFFTTGLLPKKEAPLLHLITSGLKPTVEASGVSATELVDSLNRQLHKVLDGRELTKRELFEELSSDVPKRLRAMFKTEEELITLTMTAARLVALHGGYLIAPRSGKELSFVRTDQWLGRAPAILDPDEARAELARRFLRAFAPARAEDLAWWANEHTDKASRVAHESHASETWKLIEDELDEVEVIDRSRAFVLTSDKRRLTSPPTPEGVRLLPPYDPFLGLRHRNMLVPDREIQRRLWRHTHNPGVVIAEGEPVATWSQRKKGETLIVSVEPIGPALKRSMRDEIASEAIRVGPVRAVSQVEVGFE